MPINQAMREKIANTLRFLSVDGVQAANSGHPGMPMGCADIVAVLITEFLRIDPQDPTWINRDRFILSAGHGSMLQYAMLYLAGFIQLDELKQFRQLGSRTAGHPEYGHCPGVDFTTGPLGAGFAAGVGMSIAEEMLGERFNTPKYDMINHFTYVIMGDGCNMEGVTQEAASLAGHLKPNSLIVFYDDNEISIEGSTDLAFTENVGARYEALNWHVQHIDGHNHEEIAAAVRNAQNERKKPSIIICKTTIGKGAPNLAGSAKIHGEPLGAKEIEDAKNLVGWPREAFYVPEDVKAYFESRKQEWHAIRAEWDKMRSSYDKSHRNLSKEFERLLRRELPKQWKHATPEFPSTKITATRNSGGEVMNAFGEVIPELVGGSADLAPSTKTIISKGVHPEFIAPNMFLGRNFHFGVREHAMGQICNGIAAHGGFIPFSSTFMVFHDYMRPALRTAAIMNLQQIFVYTHDSIFVGEDGPTHQPIEQLASMRAIPRVDVWRPCDANETAYAWQAALARQNGPTVLALSRQNLPTIDREKYAPAKDTLKGGYILELDPEGVAEIVVIATGSEVHLAIEVANVLREAGRNIRVVSMPCLSVFKRQADGYIRRVLPKRFKNRIVIEAGIIQGWEGILGDRGVFIGMEDFGESGPYEKLAEKYGFTVGKVLDKLAEAGY